MSTQRQSECMGPVPGASCCCPWPLLRCRRRRHACRGSPLPSARQPRAAIPHAAEHAGGRPTAAEAHPAGEWSTCGSCSQRTRPSSAPFLRRRRHPSRPASCCPAGPAPLLPATLLDGGVLEGAGLAGGDGRCFCRRPAVEHATAVAPRLPALARRHRRRAALHFLRAGPRGRRRVAPGQRRRCRRPPWPPPLPGRWRCTPRGSSLSQGPSPLSWGPWASAPA